MVRAFVLGVALLAIVGVCTVRETNKQIQARYELEQLTRSGAEAERRLARLRAEEQALRSPSRLARLVRDKKLNLYALPHSAPEVARGARERRPGEVLDGDAAGAEIDLASAE